MSHPAAHSVERHCDVCVIGGSAAGLSAALLLGRQRRPVIVVDDGRPRNAPAAHVHGYLAREGLPPAELAAAGREEVRGYGGEVIAGHAVRVTRTENGDFRVELSGGHSIVARRVLAAIGLVDELPAIAGVAEHWGGGVIHCPFCHGYELRDRPIVLIVSHPMGLHPVPLYRQLTERLTVVLHDATGVEEPALDALRAGGVDVRREQAVRIVARSDGRVAAVELDGGERIEADAVAVGPRFRVRAEPFAPLGLRPSTHPSGLGDVLEANALGETAIPGLYAAGNATDPGQQALQAAADGARAGAMIGFSLAEEDLRSARRDSASERDWDRRYERGRMWSGNPNGTLVAEVGALAPGRVLDIGAGEGGDAIWLAGRGWHVTASDIARPALDRIAAEAERRGLEIDCLHADANGLAPYGGAEFDLVSAQYASIPRTPDRRAVRNLMGAVAPGGTLLVVSHDLEPMGSAGAQAHGRPFDPDAYVRVEDVRDAIGSSPDWTIEVHETRPRPPGAATASHHVDDVVLRARRSA